MTVGELYDRDNVRKLDWVYELGKSLQFGVDNFPEHHKIEKYKFHKS